MPQCQDAALGCQSSLPPFSFPRARNRSTLLDWRRLGFQRVAGWNAPHRTPLRGQNVFYHPPPLFSPISTLLSFFTTPLSPLRPSQRAGPDPGARRPSAPLRSLRELHPPTVSLTPSPPGTPTMDGTRSRRGRRRQIGNVKSPRGPTSEVRGQRPPAPCALRVQKALDTKRLLAIMTAKSALVCSNVMPV